MRKTIILLSLALCSVLGAFAAPSESSVLWNKALTAINDDLPQEAAGYLRQIDTLTRASGDTLEMFQVSKILYETVRKYNWKEAREISPEKEALRRSLTKDLEASIKKYRNHERLPLLLEEKVNKVYGETKWDDEKGFLRIRKEIERILKKWPNCLNREFFEKFLERLDRKSLYVTRSSVAYPGDETTFRVSTRNIDTLTYVIVRTTSRDTLTRGVLPVENYQYNIQKETSLRYTFAKGGVYKAVFSAPGIKPFETTEIHVSEVALAARERGGNVEVWATNAKSGKPLQNVTVELMQNGKVYATKQISCIANFVAVGKVKTSGTTVRATWEGDSWAEPVDVYGNTTAKQDNKFYEEHAVFTDRRLYHAGNMIEWKVIAYKTNGSKANVVTGKKIKVYLQDLSESKPIAECEVTTGQFGSAGGKFQLPAGAKLGRYQIYTEGHTGVSGTLDVAEYVAPKYYLACDEFEGIYLPGDEIKVSGSFLSYAGFASSDATIRYKISSYSAGRASNESGSTLTDEKGAWAFTFKTPKDIENDALFYNIVITAIDSDGESVEIRKFFTVGRKPAVLEIDLGFTSGLDSVQVFCKEDVKDWKITAGNLNGHELELLSEYSVVDTSGFIVARGDIPTGRTFTPDLSGVEPGQYILKYKTSARGVAVSESRNILVLSKEISGHNLGRPYIAHVGKENLNFILGTGAEELCAIIELFDGHNILRREFVRLQNETRAFSWKWERSYPDAVCLNITAIKNMTLHVTSRMIEKTQQNWEHDLKLESFADKTLARGMQTITLQGIPASELTLSVYDKTCDRYRPNEFSLSAYRKDYPVVPYALCNLEQTWKVHMMNGPVMLHSNIAFKGQADSAMPESSLARDEAADSGEDGIRKPGDETMIFVPSLAADENGHFKVTMRTGEQLSTFRILAFTHSKSLSTGHAEGEFIVQKPLMTIATLPLAATEGDELVIKMKVVNVGVKDAVGEGLARVETPSGELVVELPVVRDTIASGATKTIQWKLTVPEGHPVLHVTTQFRSKDFADGEKNTLRVYPCKEKLTESVSWIVGQGKMTKEKATKELTSRLGKYYGELSYKEYKMMDAVREALSAVKRPSSDDNLIDWLTYLYVSQLRAKYCDAPAVSEKDLKRVREVFANCQNADGGLAWFKGLESSVMLTVFALEKIADLEAIGAFPDGFADMVLRAVEYVGSDISKKASEPDWDWKSVTKELRVYLRYFEEHPALAQYIAASKDTRKLSILQKAEHYEIIRGRDEKAAEKVLRSLQDYAVKNDRTGYYFPNAVPHFRGLLQTELYAHCTLMKLFASEGSAKSVKIRKGLAKWIMLQKHNQAWESTIATADAVYALMSTKAEDLTFASALYTYVAPIESVQEFSNELSASCVYYNLETGERVNEGDALHVGDRLVAHYYIRNTENRSFVQLSVAHPACLYPCDERSGRSWWYYKTTRAGRSTYYFQTLAEEDTTLSELFEVRYEGTFQSGITTIESLYAPEYRGHQKSTVWSVKN